jgi:predicted RecA/RadA family phage recombinase
MISLKWNEGNPTGIFPIAFTSHFRKKAKSVEINKATKVDGTALVIFGKKYIIAMVRLPRISSSGLMF